MQLESKDTGPRDTTESSPANPAQLAVVLAILAFVYGPTLAWLVDRWTMSVWHNVHGMFIPPVVAYLVWSELRSTREEGRSASPLGFLLVVPALLLVALDAGMRTQLLSALSLVILIPGLFLLFLGVKRTLRVAFPLTFLFFMLPIPLSFTEGIHLVLRRISAVAASEVIGALGIPVFTEATTIHLAGVTLEVADACSGFSTLYASMAVAVLVSYMGSSFPRRVAVLGVAAPVAIGVNIIRVVALILLVLWRGDGVLETFAHTLSGLLAFAAGLPIILWVGRDA